MTAKPQLVVSLCVYTSSEETGQKQYRLVGTASRADPKIGASSRSPTWLQGGQNAWATSCQTKNHMGCWLNLSLPQHYLTLPKTPHSI